MRSNISSLTRDSGTPTMYNYNGTNRLGSVSGTLNGSYTYDDNGSVHIDNVKGVIIDYNDLNLPSVITQAGTSNQVINTWLADGTKIRKVTGAVTRDYDAGIEYSTQGGSQVIEFIHTEEGRAVPVGGGAYAISTF